MTATHEEMIEVPAELYLPKPMIVPRGAKVYEGTIPRTALGALVQVLEGAGFRTKEIPAIRRKAGRVSRYIVFGDVTAVVNEGKGASFIFDGSAAELRAPGEKSKPEPFRFEVGYTLGEERPVTFGEGNESVAVVPRVKYPDEEMLASR